MDTTLGKLCIRAKSHQIRNIDPMLFYYRGSVVDAGPIIKQHWASISCLLDVRNVLLYDLAYQVCWSGITLHAPWDTSARSKEMRASPNFPDQLTIHYDTKSPGAISMCPVNITYSRSKFMENCITELHQKYIYSKFYHFAGEKYKK